MDKLKDYLVQVVLTKYLPMGAMAAISALGGLMMAHEGLLESWGINYIPEWNPAWLATHAISGKIIVVEVDTLTVVGVTAIAGLLAVAWRAFQHHTTGTTTPAAAPPAGLV